MKMKSFDDLQNLKQQHNQQQQEKILVQTVECCDFNEMLQEFRGFLHENKILRNTDLMPIHAFHSQTTATANNPQNLDNVNLKPFNKSYPKYIQNIQTNNYNKPIWKSILFNDKNHFNLSQNNSMSLNVTNSFNATQLQQQKQFKTNLDSFLNFDVHKQKIRELNQKFSFNESQKSFIQEPAQQSQTQQSLPQQQHQQPRKLYVGSSSHVKLKSIPVIEHKITFTVTPTSPVVPQQTVGLTTSRKEKEKDKDYYYVHHNNNEPFLPPIKSSYSSHISTREDVSTANSSSQMSTLRNTAMSSHSRNNNDTSEYYPSDSLTDALIVSKISPSNKYESENENDDGINNNRTVHMADKTIRNTQRDDDDDDLDDEEDDYYSNDKNLNTFSIDDIDDPFILKALKNKSELDKIVRAVKKQHIEEQHHQHDDDAPPPNSPILNKNGKVMNTVAFKTTPDPSDTIHRSSDLITNSNKALSLNGSSIAYHLTEPKQFHLNKFSNNNAGSGKNSTKLPDAKSSQTPHGKNNKSNKNNNGMISVSEKHTKLPIVQSINNKLHVDIFIPSGSLI